MKQLTVEDVRMILAQAAVDMSALTLTADPRVWTDVTTRESGSSVLVEGPETAREVAKEVLLREGLAVAPYGDRDYWTM